MAGALQKAGAAARGAAAGAAAGAGAGAGVGAGAGRGAAPAAQFFDIAANLTDGMFARGEYHGRAYHEPDGDLVLERAWAAGVRRIMVTGGALAESREALDLARRDPRLVCTVGVHPTRCSEFEAAPGGGAAHLDALLALAREGQAEGKCAAVGECGLDYARLQFCPKETQQAWFRAQFGLAETTGLPMFLHLRDAADDFLQILHENRARFGQAVVHSFDGSLETLERLLAFDGVSIGVNGCSLRTEENLAVAAHIPADRLMLETDAPWCEVKNSHAGSKFLAGPRPAAKEKKKFQRGLPVKGRNEPAGIAQVLEVLAGARGEEPEVLAAQVYENSCKMFRVSALETGESPGRG